MESNSFCNHMSDWRRSPVCLITGKLEHKKFREFLLAVKKKLFKCARARWRVLSNYLGSTVLLHRQLIGNQIWEFCYSYY